MSADKTEKENLLNAHDTKGDTYYDEENQQTQNDTLSTVDGIKTVAAILFVIFECIPIITGGYILNTHYSLYFAGIFSICVFLVMFVAKEKFHYVLILLFLYVMYVIMLFAIASDAYKQSNADLYHIEKIKTISVLWIIVQLGLVGWVYNKCCSPSQSHIDATFQADDDMNDFD